MSARVALFASLASLLLLAGTLAGAAELSAGAPTPTPAPARVDVQMTSATLGDDCGGGRPHVPTRSKSEKSDAANDVGHGARAKMKRRCEQTSMQLAVVSPGGAATTELHVKRVELLDDGGRVVGELTPERPTVWNASGSYVEWNERVDPATSLSVSYALSQPDWSTVSDRWNRTFTIRATITVAGGDQTVQRDVVAEAPTSLPPNVKT